MGLIALAKKATPDTHSPHKSRPNHFPSTPFLNPPKPPAISPPPQHVPHNRSSQMTTDSATSKQSTWKKDPFERRPNIQAPPQAQAATSIYEAFSRASGDTRTARREPVVEIDDTSNRRPRTADLLSPVHPDRHRGVSRSSSLDGLSNTGSIYSPNSTMTDLTDLGDLSLRFPRSPHEAGYESSSSAHRGGRRHRSNVRAQMMNAEVLEEHVDEDKVSAHHLNTLRARNKSVNSIASKIKADKMLGLDAPDTSLVSAYFCSGLGLLPEAWSLADSDAIRSIRPSDDSMGVFWRPELLHNAFSGDSMSDLFVAGQNAHGRPVIVETHPKSLDPANRLVPDAGLQASKLIAAKCIKAAHPKDVEVINSPTCPPSTCHTFSFTLPLQDTLATIARTRVNAKLPPGVNATQAAYQAGFIDSQVGLDPRGYHGSAKPEPNFKQAAEAKGARDPTDIRYYGVTVLTWYHADEKRHEVLERIHNKLGPESELARPASMRSVRSSDISLSLLAASADKPKRRRLKMPWGTSRTPSENGQIDTPSEVDTHFTDYEPDKRSPLARLGIRVTKNPPKTKQYAQLQQDDYSPKVMASGGVFWIPVAHTLVSRHPIYDTMLDFLRLDIGQFSRDAYWHNVNVLRLLNTATPRPGELYRLRVGTARDDDIALEAYMPGAVDFEKGIVKVDYQLWPLFQAVDFDHLLVCIDVAMSQTGRIIMTSKYTYMLSVAVNTLKYILDLQGWQGIAIPIVHARDTPLIVEDPGPYIIGLPSEFKALVTVPPEVVFVDLDTSSLVCKKMPAFVSTKTRRDKAKARLTAVFGPEYTEIDRNVPIDFKVSNPMGCFQHLNRLQFPGGRKPKYVGQAMTPPSWWRQTEIMTAFDKIMADKFKKPTLIQRLTRSGVNRAEAQLSVGEQVAKVMMRRRALHYVESRDQLEIKVAKVNARLAAIAVDGRFWRAEFQKFESYAQQLAVHTERLRVMIDREKQDTKRYSNMAAEQTKARTDLESKLQATEDARAEAMRQLSDMHHSIQELEREREQIMDVFEDTLNIALDTIPEAIPQSPTQATGALSPPRSPVAFKSATSRSRPTTRDSEMSTLSRLTTIKPPSMMGSMRSGMPPMQGAATSIFSGEAFDNRAFERSDYVSHRIAAIQAKLEIALQSSASRSISVPTGLETVEDEDDDEDGTIQDHDAIPSAQPKRAASALAHTGESPAQSIAAHVAVRPEIPSPMRAAARKRPSSVQVQSSNFNTVGDTTFGDGTDRAGALARLLGNSVANGTDGVDLAHEQNKAYHSTTSSGDDSVSRRNSLMKPGVQYRIRPKRYSMTSTNGRQSAGGESATSEHSPDMDSVPRLHKHEKVAATSTNGGDVSTPSTSMLDHLQRVEKGPVVHIDADTMEDKGSLGIKDHEKEDDRRLSAISTATVTFGQ